MASNRSLFYCSCMTWVEPCGFKKEQILVLHKCGEWHSTLSTQQIIFWNWENEFLTRYWAYDWTQRKRLNNEKQKVNNLNTSRHARNNSNPESRQTKQETRHIDVLQRRETSLRTRSQFLWVVFPTLFSFVILISLWHSISVFLKKSHFLTFTLSAHLSILKSLIFYPSPGWLMDKQQVAGSCP